MEKGNNYELIMCIVNTGFTDLVMEAAKKAGAKGGTVFHGRGTGNKDITEFFGITITPEKEVVMIIVPKEIRDVVMNEIYKDAGMESRGQGIAFSMPIDDVVGLVDLEKIANQ